jgi:hypothetical protein
MALTVLSKRKVKEVGNLSEPLNTSSPMTNLGPSNKVHSDEIHLHLEKILLKQFDFASETSHQARQDTSQLIYFYFVALGVLVAGLGFLLQLANESRSYLQLGVLVILVAAGIMHDAIFIRFVRLRQRYIASFARMSQIADVYITRFKKELPEIDQILQWSSHSQFVPSPVFAFFPYAIYAVLGSAGFALAVIVGDELWLGKNDGAIFPLPNSLDVYVFSVGVFVISLAIIFSAGLALRAALARSRVTVKG